MDKNKIIQVTTARTYAGACCVLDIISEKMKDDNTHIAAIYPRYSSRMYKVPKGLCIGTLKKVLYSANKFFSCPSK